LRKTDLIIKDENARRLRLKILLLENENADLRGQLVSADDRIDGLEQEGDDVRAELDNTREDLQRQEAESRSQARELNILKVCLHFSMWSLLTVCRRN
jgi:predicted  nucleic acid-binding Zn-ribbon protein